MIGLSNFLRVTERAEDTYNQQQNFQKSTGGGQAPNNAANWQAQTDEYVTRRTM